MKRKYARVEPFLALTYRPEDLLHQDQGGKRFITPREIAFVGSRITTSILRNSGVTDAISYRVFLDKWRDDYIMFSDRKPSRYKLGRIVEVLAHYGMINKYDRRKATPLYFMGEKNPYKNPNFDDSLTSDKKTKKDLTQTDLDRFLIHNKQSLEAESLKAKSKINSFLKEKK